MATLKLQSSDGEIFTVNIEVAKKCQTIKTMLEALNCDSNMDEAVPILKVRGEILKKVIEWSEHHVKDSFVDDLNPLIPEPYNWPVPTDDISEWDKEFMNVSMPTAFELILAANFLDVKGLMDLACKTVASRIKGKSPKEMRDILNLSPGKSKE